MILQFRSDKQISACFQQNFNLIPNLALEANDFMRFSSLVSKQRNLENEKLGLFPVGSCCLVEGTPPDPKLVVLDY